MHSPNTKKDLSFAQDVEAYLQEIIQSVDASSASDPEDGPPSGRKKVLPSLMLWSGVLVGMLRGFTSQSDIWRLVSWHGFWSYAPRHVSDQAVFNRLGQVGEQTLQKIFVCVRDGLQERLAPFAQQGLAPFASGVYAIDGSTLDKMARMLPSLRAVPNGDSRLLPGKMVGLFNLRIQQWQDMIHLPNPDQNDKVAARELVEKLPQGSLILGDMGFFSFAWFDQLTDWKLWWISRIRKRTTYELIHTHYGSLNGDLFDGIVWLGRYRADKAAHAVRMVCFKLNGTQFRYLTNVLDPKQLSLHEIAVLYARRWDIELAFKMLKRHLKLHLIWSAKPAIVLQQLWAALTIAQLVHAVQMEIAGLAKVDPFDVSLDLITRYVPSLAREGKDPINMIVQDGQRMRLIRPSQRIRPKTPDLTDYRIRPLPAGTVLIRNPRYAERRSQTTDLRQLGATRLADIDP